MKKISSILSMKCPNCKKGDLFETGLWSFQKPFEMHKECPNCQLDYFPEPGFYYGAMFISYIMWGWVCVFIGGGAMLGLGWSVNQATIALILFSATFFIWLFRMSRSIWIHIAPGISKIKG